MTYNEMKELVTTRQSCRNFNEQEVTKDEIDKILELVRLCPSACNSQPWQLYCTVNKTECEKITECLQEGGRNPFLSKAKGYIVVAEKDTSLGGSADERFTRNHFVKYDVGEMIAYITLTAKSLGVESCIIGWINHDKLRSVLDMPSSENCNVVVALGHSDIALREKVRKPLDEIAKIL